MANKILTFSDLEESSNFPPKVDWSALSILSPMPTFFTPCCTVGRVKNKYLVTSTEDDNKLAVENDFQEKDVIEYNFSISVLNGGISGRSSPTKIAITGYFGFIIYDEGDYQVLEWNTIGQLRSVYTVNNNLVNFPKAYVVRDRGEINVSITDLSIEVTYEDGSSKTFDNKDLALVRKDYDIRLTVSHTFIPDIPIEPDDPIETTVNVILRYDFSDIVKNGTVLYNPMFVTVYYNQTGNLTGTNNVVNFIPPATISPNKMVVEYTLGRFLTGSSIYLWLNGTNHYCGTASTSLQSSMTPEIRLMNELTIAPTEYTIPSYASETYYIIIPIYKG